MAGDPSPLHGQGWLNAWTVDEASEHGAVLSFVHPAGEWPWSYAARQEFALDENGPLAALTCRNQFRRPDAVRAWPASLFPVRADTQSIPRSTDVWTIDEHVLPVEKVPATGRYDLRDRPVCGQGLDHGFGGWGGEARMSDPDWPLRCACRRPTRVSSSSIRPPRRHFRCRAGQPRQAALNAAEEAMGGAWDARARAGRSDEPGHRLEVFACRRSG